MDSSSAAQFQCRKTVAGQTINNMVYIVDTSAEPNGHHHQARHPAEEWRASCPSGGLTIVSGNPVYIQGDYNTGSGLQLVPGTPPLIQPPSNLTGDSTQPTVAGYTKQPSAVIGDAVNILSNSWIDANSGTNPVASPTTVNTAIISGNVPSGNGYYSGGLENFPRFLENWGGKQFTYYGSMIQLYQSQQAIGHLGRGQRLRRAESRLVFRHQLRRQPASRACSSPTITGAAAGTRSRLPSESLCSRPDQNRAHGTSAAVIYTDFSAIV